MDRKNFRPEQCRLTAYTSPGTEWPVRMGWAIRAMEKREAVELFRVYSRFTKTELWLRWEERSLHIRRLWALSCCRFIMEMGRGFRLSGLDTSKQG